MMRMMILSVFVAGVFALFAIADTAAAWNIQPVPSSTDKKIGKFDPWYKKLKRGSTAEIAAHYAKPQHEDIAHRIFGCEEEDCRFPQPGIQKSAPSAVIAGVRWNDTPPFTLLKTRTPLCPVDKVITIINYPECWGILFKDAKKQGRGGKKVRQRPVDPGALPLAFRRHAVPSLHGFQRAGACRGDQAEDHGLGRVHVPNRPG